MSSFYVCMQFFSIYVLIFLNIKKKKNLFVFQRPDDYRRKWDREEYERLARERLFDDEDLDLDWKIKEKQPPVRREFLKPRDYRVRL